MSKEAVVLEKALARTVLVRVLVSVGASAALVALAEQLLR